MNVALTRCRKGMVVVTNKCFLSGAGRNTLLGKLCYAWSQRHDTRIDWKAMLNDSVGSGTASMALRHLRPSRPSFYTRICVPTVTSLYSDPRTLWPRPAHRDRDATTQCTAGAAADNDNGDDVRYVPIPIIDSPFTRDRGPTTTRTTRSVAVPRVRSPSPALSKVGYSTGLRNGILQTVAAAASTTAAETAALTTDAEAGTTAETAAEKKKQKIAATATATMVGAEVDDLSKNP